MDAVDRQLAGGVLLAAEHELLAGGLPGCSVEQAARLEGVDGELRRVRSVGVDDPELSLVHGVHQARPVRRPVGVGLVAGPGVEQWMVVGAVGSDEPEVDPPTLVVEELVGDPRIRRS